MIVLIIFAGLLAITMYAIIETAARTDAQEAKIWAETVENRKYDRTLVRNEKRVRNENTASKGGGKHDIKERAPKHSRKA